MNADMEALLSEAEKTGQWLHCAYQDIWFSPQELRAAQRQGEFRWGTLNWKLRDPNEKLAELDRQAEDIRAERDRFESRWEVSRK